MEEDSSADKLRQHLRANKLKYVYRDGQGNQKTLSKEDMQHLIGRVAHSMEGEQRIKVWLTSRCGLSPSRGPPIAIAFWHSLDESSLRLPDHCCLGLASAIARGKMDVKLLTYQSLTHVPPGVQVIDARPFVPHDKFEASLKSGVHVAILSDYVRLSAIAHRRDSYAWFIDCDSLWVRQPPSCATAYYGHTFGSLEGDVRGSTEARARFWMTRFLAKQSDKLFLASPFGFPRDSPVVQDMVAWFESRLEQGISIAYSDPFTHLKHLIISWGLEKACVSAQAFSPLHYASKGSSLKRGSFKQETFNQIVTESYCINNFWASSKHGGEIHERGSAKSIQVGSLWAGLCEHACPGVLKTLTLKRALPEVQTSREATLQWPFEIGQDSKSFRSMTPFVQTPLYQQYELVSELGHGTYGTVFVGRRRCQHDDPDALVAIKVVCCRTSNDITDARELFYLEKFRSSKHVIEIIDGWLSPWVYVMVLEKASVDLWQYMKTNRESMSVLLKWSLFHNIASGVSEIHAQGLMHRDLYAKNVLLFNSCTGYPTAKLTDLGLACGLSTEAETILYSQNAGALCTRAPDIFFCKGAKYSYSGLYVGASKCKYDQSADVWSIGTLLLLLDLGRYAHCPEASSSTTPGKFAKSLLQEWGMPATNLSRRLHWSFGGLGSLEGLPTKVSHNICEASMLLSTVMKMMNYDPQARATAIALVSEASKMLDVSGGSSKAPGVEA